MTELQALSAKFLDNPRAKLLGLLFQEFVFYPTRQVRILGLVPSDDTIGTISKFFVEADREWRELSSKLSATGGTLFTLHPDAVKNRWRNDLPEVFDLIQWEAD